ncbi:MAG: hypothetical protein ACXV3F_00255 [Frankiaceae bacterium]
MLSALVEPAYCSVPPSQNTLGDEVAELAAMAGFAPDPEQRLALDHLFAMKPDGRVAAMEFAVICSRQNLKTGLFKQAALGWLFVTEERLVVWSAHEFGTAQEAFRDMSMLIESCPMLDRRVKQMHKGNGDEAIELKNGSRLKFKARTKGGGRGLSGGKVVLDEAYALKPEHMGALLPLLSAQPDPQVVYGSSAGHATSEVLRAVRDRGRAGGDPSLAYLEWCDDLPGECENPRCDHDPLTVKGCRLDDRARWARANPAMGRRIGVEYIANERRALPPAEFARERLGWWDEPDADEPPVIHSGAWADQEDADSAPEDPYGVCFAVSVSQDRTWAQIASAGRRADGGLHVEIVDNRRGTRWVIDRVVELRDRWQPCAVVVNPAGPEGSLIADLTEAGVDVVQPTSRDLGQAFGMFFDGVMVEKTLWHRPDALLGVAVEAARSRPLGDAKTWDQRGSTDISPLVAASNALWGFNVHGAERAPVIW